MKILDEEQLRKSKVAGAPPKPIDNPAENFKEFISQMLKALNSQGGTLNKIAGLLRDLEASVTDSPNANKINFTALQAELKQIDNTLQSKMGMLDGFSLQVLDALKGMTASMSKVAESADRIPDLPKKWVFTVERDEQGFIKEIEANRGE